MTDNELEKIQSCDQRLQDIINKAKETNSFQVICGRRGQADQDKAYADGKSKLMFPHSKHNPFPSQAFDAVPIPLDWNDIKAFTNLADNIKQTAKDLNIPITWGGDFKTFKDYDHFELI